MLKTDDKNKEWEEAIVNELAKKLQNSGWSLSSVSKTFIVVLWGITATLIGILYTQQVSADVSARADIAQLQTNEITVNSRLQRIESNIYLICKTMKVEDCLPAIPPK